MGGPTNQEQGWVDQLMYIIKKRSPIQRMTSDGYPMTDRTDGKSETAERDYGLHPEALLLTPEQNNGKWLFNLNSAMSWEVEPQYVDVGRQRRIKQNDPRGSAGASP